MPAIPDNDCVSISATEDGIKYATILYLREVFSKMSGNKDYINFGAQHTIHDFCNIFIGSGFNWHNKEAKCILHNTIFDLFLEHGPKFKDESFITTEGYKDTFDRVGWKIISAIQELNGYRKDR